MKQFIKDNWFKIALIVTFFYSLNTLVNAIDFYIASQKKISQIDCEEKMLTSTNVDFYIKWHNICDEIN